MADRSRFEGLGPNVGLVEELYRQYLEDPSSVGEGWREYFADYAPASAPASADRTPPASPASAAAASRADARRRPPAPPHRPTRSRSAAARCARSRTWRRASPCPTATSVRTMPAKLLEVNRSILNNQLARTGRGKVSFTHIIGYAVARALTQVPAMNASYATVGGKPGIVRPPHVNLGLAVDLQKRDGTRTLLVPNVKSADTLDFAAFVRRVRGGDPPRARGRGRPEGLRGHDRDASPTPA